MFGSKCQSCGMPLSKDENGGGSNSDGSRSQDYCSHCYANGKFVDPYLTCEQMQAKVREKMQEMTFPGFLANMFVKKIPQLRRWQVAGASH